MQNHAKKKVQHNHIQRSYLFTVRVWSEQLAYGQKEWRGQIRFVKSGETRYFRTWSQLENFLERMLDEVESSA